MCASVGDGVRSAGQFAGRMETAYRRGWRVEGTDAEMLTAKHNTVNLGCIIRHRHFLSIRNPIQITAFE